MFRSAATLAAAAALIGGAAEASLIATEASSCSAQEQAHRSKVLQKLATFDVKCEEMCKKLGAYPDGCECPGFGSSPSSSGDMRACIDQYCQDPSTPCPTEGFVNCVDAATKVSALQWSSVSKRADATFGAFAQMFGKVQRKQESCASHTRKHHVLLQQRLATFDVKCEEMCKKLGAYPDGCECPGFGSSPASSGDMRACIDQYCQDPANPCPTPGFVTCVDETTKVSALQWKALSQKLESSLDGFKHMLKRVRVAEKSK